MREENTLLRYGNRIFRRAFARTLAGLGTVALACVVLVADTARAEPAPQITLGDLSHAGLGCPRGTVDVKLGRGGDFIQLGFDAFTVNAGETPPTRGCEVHVPIKVRRGTRLVLQTIRGRGDANIPSGGMVTMGGSFKLGNCSPVNFQQSLSGPSQQAFLFTKSGTSCQTPCGKDTTLRGRITFTAQNPTASRVNTVIKLDSMTITLRVVEC